MAEPKETPVLVNHSEDEMETTATTIDTDKLSYEIFSILESKFLFGYDDHHHHTWGPPPANPTAASAAFVGDVKNQRGKVCILSIDGGSCLGMRALLPGKALAYLEQSLKSKSGDPNATVSDYFDLAAGTGVGSLFAAMLFSARDGGSRPASSANDTWRFLVENRNRLFPMPQRNSPRGLFSCVAKSKSTRSAAKEALGDSLTLRDALKPLLIPCYDMLTSAPLVFSRADAVESESYDFRLWEACRASWAEPGRAGPVEVRSVDERTVCVGVDGGLAMSNPTAAAITHVLHNKQEFPFVRGVEDVMVLSLGCGSSGSGSGAESGRVEECRRIRKWGAREWAQPIARIAASGAADLVDHAVAMAFGECRSNNYVRIQANGSIMNQCGANIDCDASTENVRVLLRAAEEMLKQKNVDSTMFVGKKMSEQTNMEKLDWFAGELVLEHQRRSCRIAPTVAFKQPTPKPK